jgi:hypothetical protein
MSRVVRGVTGANCGVTMERGPAQRNGRAGPLRGMNYPESGVRRETAGDRPYSDRSSTSPIRCAPLLSRRLVRRFSDGSLSLTAHFLTAAAGTVKPQCCGCDASRDERADNCDERSPPGSGCAPKDVC